MRFKYNFLLVNLFCFYNLFYSNLLFSLTEYLKDPTNSLHHFMQNLIELDVEDSSNDERVRVMFLGTSTNGYDRVTSEMRRILQDKFGDGGKGFIVMKKGWKYYKHQDIEWKYSKWISNNITANRREDGRYGPGGVLSYNKSFAQTIFETVSTSGLKKEDDLDYVPGTSFSEVTFLYQSFPGGGTFNTKIDDLPIYKINTDNKKIADKAYKININDGSHKVTVKTGKAEVRMYGAIFERESGIVIDGNMLVGSRAKTFYNFHQSHIKSYIKYRDPDLLIFQMGANDVKHNINKKNLKNFIIDYINAINLIRSGKPLASCLVISIKDMGKKSGSKILTKPGVQETVKAAEKVALKTECAFFNLFEAMGGEGVMGKWRSSDPVMVSKDYGHLLDPGAKRIGEIISNLILEKYNIYNDNDK